MQDRVLSVIMPVYNEEKTLSAIIDKVLAIPIVKELIIVNDASTDQSALVLEEYSNVQSVKIIHHQKNQGKGAAIRTGIAYITGSVTIIQDADLEYDPKDYCQLVEPILSGRQKVVYGSRFLSVHLDKQKNKVVDRPNLYLALLSISKTMIMSILRSKIKGGPQERPHTVFFLGGVTVTLITNLLYGQQLTDEPTCYKTFDSDLLKSLDLQCERFEFCPEVTARVARRGIKIIEFPIQYYPRKVDEGKKIKWFDGVEAIWTLVKYRFINLQTAIPKALPNHKSALLEPSASEKY